MPNETPQASSDPTADIVSGLEQIASTYQAQFDQAQSEHALREIAAKVIGPQGRLTTLLKQMRHVPGDKKRDIGQRSNALKQAVSAAFDARLQTIAADLRRQELEGPALDPTLPARAVEPGHLHPLTQITNELLSIFGSMGFDVADGPEVERYDYNFTKLAFAPDHPATDMQDTFFVEGEEDGNALLLRTHTSPVQVREMLARKPPLAVVTPGAVYRRDDDITHSPMFFQLEGFMVGENITFANLKGTLTHFIQQLFGENVPVRLRPSYFPFVEPGAEMDCGCVFCEPWDGGADPACRLCKGSGWIEILGCGMIHPRVFEHVGYDPERYTGFAFGLGIDRVAMLRFGISNIRSLYENDPRFLAQF